jgi:hypothetical protein
MRNTAVNVCTGRHCAGRAYAHFHQHRHGVNVYHRDLYQSGSCDVHIGLHAFRNDPDPCIGWHTC